MRRLLLFLALAAAVPGFSDVPVRVEQFVYTVLAFNGKDYSATFVTEGSDVIYLLSGADNFLSARKCLVYFWPITGEWKSDTDNLNVFLPGALELRDGRGRTQRIPLDWFTYFNVRGEYEQNWKVAVGDAAAAEYSRNKALYDAYFAAVSEYYRRNAAYEAEIESLSARIQKLKDAGKDVTALLERMRTLQRPEQPQPPKDYTVPPLPAQQAFRLNLPPGAYTIRLLNEDGTVMQGSEKRVIVHERRRANGWGSR